MYPGLELQQQKWDAAQADVVFLYNRTDEQLTWTFNAHSHVLKPRQKKVVPRYLADAAVSQLKVKQSSQTNAVVDSLVGYTTFNEETGEEVVVYSIDPKGEVNLKEIKDAEKNDFGDSVEVQFEDEKTGEVSTEVLPRKKGRVKQPPYKPDTENVASEFVPPARAKE